MPDDSIIMFTYVEALKPAKNMQVLLARPNMLVEVELLAEKADMVIFTSGQHHYDGQLRRYYGQDYQRTRAF